MVDPEELPLLHFFCLGVFSSFQSVLLEHDLSFIFSCLLLWSWRVFFRCGCISCLANIFYRLLRSHSKFLQVYSFLGILCRSFLFKGFTRPVVASSEKFFTSESKAFLAIFKIFTVIPSGPLGLKDLIILLVSWAFAAGKFFRVSIWLHLSFETLGWFS